MYFTENGIIDYSLESCKEMDRFIRSSYKIPASLDCEFFYFYVFRGFELFHLKILYDFFVFLHFK
jgi:hypothetical protein